MFFFVLEGSAKHRYEIYPDYKGNRIKTGSKLEQAEKVSKSREEIYILSQHLPISFTKAVNYECDDVISTLCENMKDEELIVVSDDSDFIQLLQKDYK